MTMAEELIGEELVDASNVYAFADAMFAEADRLWASPSTNWQVASKTPNVTNECTAVSGVYADARVDVWRASATIHAPAQLVFDLIVSHEGRYQIIDPYSNPKDAKPLLETFDASQWRKSEENNSSSSSSMNRRLEAATTVAKIPFMYAREFVVLNAVDHAARCYVSKSILHRNAPGASVWCTNIQEIARQDPKKVRGVNSFAVRVVPVGQDMSEQCVVHLINYANLAGSFSTTIQNQFNKAFLTGIISRLQKAAENSDRVGAKHP